MQAPVPSEARISSKTARGTHGAGQVAALAGRFGTKG